MLELGCTFLFSVLVRPPAGTGTTGIPAVPVLRTGTTEVPVPVGGGGRNRNDRIVQEHAQYAKIIIFLALPSYIYHSNNILTLFIQFD